MRTYRRARIAGGTYFFTLALAQRRRTLLVDHIDALRTAFRHTRRDHGFVIEAIAILPDHLHCLLRLPMGDTNYSAYLRLIKARFSQSMESGEFISPSRSRKGERGIWQRRFWEHAIRDERDWKNHMDYIHYNPVKHGLAERVRDWPFSSFHRYVKMGFYPANWGENVTLNAGE